MAAKKKKTVAVKLGAIVTKHGKRSIVVGKVPSTNFSRAYGTRMYICTFYGKKARQVFVDETSAGGLRPVGFVKKIPAACQDALAEHIKMNPMTHRPGYRG